MLLSIVLLLLFSRKKRAVVVVLCTYPEREFRVHVQRKPFDLNADHVTVGGWKESQYADSVLPAIFVQQLSVPFVHVQVPVIVLEHDDWISTFVQIRECW